MVTGGLALLEHVNVTALPTGTGPDGLTVATVSLGASVGKEPADCETVAIHWECLLCARQHST